MKPVPVGSKWFTSNEWGGKVVLNSKHSPAQFMDLENQMRIGQTRPNKARVQPRYPIVHKAFELSHSFPKPLAHLPK
jgi:hypothetical protein